MYICRGHFLSPYVVALVDGKPVERLIAIDSDLMVAQRLVGFNPEDGSEVTDLVKIDEIMVSSDLPDAIVNLLPEGCLIMKEGDTK